MRLTIPALQAEAGTGQEGNPLSILCTRNPSEVTPLWEDRGSKPLLIILFLYLNNRAVPFTNKRPDYREQIVEGLRPSAT